MQPTEILSSEHQVILQVLKCLEKMAERLETDGTLEPDAARDAVDFFRNFADRCHHGKEEAHLFPAMEAKGFSRQHGPTGVMLQEHEQGRSHVRGMAESLEAAAAKDPEAQKQFLENARRYLRLLREHIDKEDHCLFPMANQAFGDEDQQRLLASFQKVESEQIGPGVHERYLKIADSLAARYQVPQEATKHAAGHHCCGH